MFPVPNVQQLAAFSGRPVASYTGYAQSALLQATLLFTILTELSADDYSTLAPDDQVLSTQGILAYSDYIYLRQPYQQALANPFLTETIGSYSYSKPPGVEMRNVQAQELGANVTGVMLWDTAIQYLSKRTRAGGVFSGEMVGMERFHRIDNIVVREDEEGNKVLLGPADFQQLDLPFTFSGESFPADPGIG